MVEVKFEPKISDLQLARRRACTPTTTATAASSRTCPTTAGLEHTHFDGQWAGVEQRFVYTPSTELRLTGGGEIQRHFLVAPVRRQRADVDGIDARRLRTPSRSSPATCSPTSCRSRRLKLSGGVAVRQSDAFSTTGALDASLASINPRLAVIIKPYKRRHREGPRRQGVPRAEHLRAVLLRASAQLANAATCTPSTCTPREIEYSHRFSSTVTGLVAAYANYITEPHRAARPVEGANPRRHVRTAPATRTPTRPSPRSAREVEVRREWKDGWMVAASYSRTSTRKYVVARHRDRRPPLADAEPGAPRGAERAGAPRVVHAAPCPSSRARSSRSRASRSRPALRPQRPGDGSQTDAAAPPQTTPSACALGRRPLGHRAAPGASSTRSASTTRSTGAGASRCHRSSGRRRSRRAGARSSRPRSKSF